MIKLEQQSVHVAPNKAKTDDDLKLKNVIKPLELLPLPRAGTTSQRRSKLKKEINFSKTLINFKGEEIAKKRLLSPDCSKSRERSSSKRLTSYASSAKD